MRAAVDEQRKDALLAKARIAGVRADDVSRGQPVGTHLNILADAVRTLAGAVKEILEEV
jgi:hypothetical protein